MTYKGFGVVHLDKLYPHGLSARLLKVRMLLTNEARFRSCSPTTTATASTTTTVAATASTATTHPFVPLTLLVLRKE